MAAFIRVNEMQAKLIIIIMEEGRRSLGASKIFLEGEKQSKASKRFMCALRLQKIRILAAENISRRGKKPKEGK